MLKLIFASKGSSQTKQDQVSIDALFWRLNSFHGRIGFIDWLDSLV